MYEEVHLFISGVVQGVGYRHHSRKKATELGLAGWVRNLPDGRVEATAQGRVESLDAFIQWCRRGPNHARVDSVEIECRVTIAQLSLKAFEIW